MDVEAVDLALTLGLSVGTLCCKDEHSITGTKVTCPSFHACAYQAQLVVDPPDVRIVPHQLLFQAQKVLGQSANVVVDDSFLGGRPWDLDPWSCLSTRSELALISR